MINLSISQLIDYAKNNKLIKEADAIYSTNRLLNLIGADNYEAVSVEKYSNIEQILNPILDFANKNGKLVSNTTAYRDIMSADIMDCFTPRPSEIIKKFNSLQPKKATDYFYALSKATNYIMTERVKKDIVWTTPTKYGDIIITINLSKPEKDPKDIAAAKLLKQSGYPKCFLCVENEGFEGNANHPGRANHRIVPIKINNEAWYLQYSPYVYYNEHCIIFNKNHIPMKIELDTFKKLTSFVQQYPHYFAGSNADLPIVGGSILTHDHFQGGSFTFPMEVAKSIKNVVFEGYDDVDASIVNWALSTIRLNGNRDRICELAGKILDNWRTYSDTVNDIIAFTDAPHNTITPIARMRNGKCELDLILRNNRTSKEHPTGTFHAHKEYHNLKKENIGLIEAMGLAVLPSRLKTELTMVIEALNDRQKEKEFLANENMAHHFAFYADIKANIKNVNPSVYIRQRVAEAFSDILENCGVFKMTDKGLNGFIKFIESVK